MRLMLVTALALYALPTIQSADAKAIRLKCEYPALHDPDKAGPQRADGFNLEFVIDDATREAVMVGNAGMSSVIFHKGADGFTFIEPLGTGAVQTTTVGFDGRSVHSRHTLIARSPVPSQYYGQCQ